MLVRHHLRKILHPRPGTQGRGRPPVTRASDIILVMMAGLLVIACILRILQG